MIFKSRAARSRTVRWSFEYDVVTVEFSSASCAHRFGERTLPACHVRHPAERFRGSHLVFGKMPSTAGWKPALPNPMNSLTLSQIVAFADGNLESGAGNVSVSKVSTDSRTLKRGELFVALRGENFDGHKFVAAAVKAGAAGVIIDLAWKEKIPESVAIIRVEDTLQAYQKLAANYRKSLPLRVLAITGSNGKTSTKDFAAAVLGRRFHVTKTEGNFNNHVGLPRTMLEATSQDEVAVWEIGMNHPGEVSALAKLAAPDAAIVTNVGIAHIEFMGSRDAIAIEKGMLAEAVGPQGAVILNADDPFTKDIAARTRAKVICAGTTAGTIRASEITQSSDGSDFTIYEGAHRCRAQLPVPGLHMVQNALLAVAAGRVFGLSLEESAAGLAGAPLTKARLQIKEIHGVKFIDDSYNANPDSMKAALRTLVELDADGKRIAVLGEMRELGDESVRAHREVGETAAELGIDQLIAVGEMGSAIAEAAQKAGLEKAAAVRSTNEAAEILSDIAAPGDLVLIKGSRAARTELVIEEFAHRQPTEGISS
ncbi:MAG: UDP-N-acetylmuramoyl-tripeptide--D-alanyl-D-alanine ligase [Verrucomicrobia bacterium]|nr:MAG: UDP-N-acetylmuramoyl-tripeptide--D-alanyl-D-alanine ligase [Verrucomicrobiota bacterium]